MSKNFPLKAPPSHPKKIIIFYFRKFLTCHKREFHTRAGLDRSMECDICNKVFKNKNTLRKHKRYYHWGELKGDKKCSICGEEKANKYVLERHMETHKNPLEREKFECLGRDKSMWNLQYYSLWTLKMTDSLLYWQFDMHREEIQRQGVRLFCFDKEITFLFKIMH